MNSNSSISLKGIFLRYRWKILVTFLLVIFESLVFMLYPLFIGKSIDSLLKDSYVGLIYLSVLGVISLITGAARRFYDTRVYSKIYAVVSAELVESENSKNTSASKISARTNMLDEIMEFLENSFPDITSNILMLFGVMIIIAFINIYVFWGCVIATTIALFVYLISSKRLYRLNKGLNNEFEKQVIVIQERKSTVIRGHFKKIAFFNVKLSDLETWNFSVIWLFFVMLVIYSIVVMVKGGKASYGEIFSVIMYVFEFIETMIMLPLYYQQFVRLYEISTRLSSSHDE